MELTKHGKGGSYFYHRNCTVYLMYRHFSKELGHHRLAFEDGFAMTFIDTYILKGKWQLDESDQFMFADNFQNGPYILKEDGSKIVLSDKDCIHVGRYHLNKPYLDVEEFHNDNNWEVIEEFAEYIGGRDNIWYATNIEIYDYVTAYRRLERSYDDTIIHNPSVIDVWVEINDNTYCIKGGETITL